MSNKNIYADETMLKRLLLLLLASPTMAWAAFVPPFTILFDSRDIEVTANAGFTRIDEKMVQIDTAQGIDLSGQVKLYYNGKRATQKVLEAYTIKPNGDKVQVSPDRIKVRNSEADDLAPYFSDQMMTIIIFPQVEIGSKVYYKAITEQKEPILKGQYSNYVYFTPHRRYDNTRIRVTHPPELPLQVNPRDITGTRSTLPDGRIEYVYEFKQDTAYPPEPNRVELTDFAPGVQFSTFSSYAELAKTFQSLIQPKTQVTPPVQKLADELTQGATTTRQKAQKLYDWVSANIRYVGIDVGASGFEPHSADEILANRYGDCKDHVTLLESLLLAVGIPSSPALVNVGDTYTLPKLAGTNFDHVITYVPTLDLYLDSTAQFAQMGAQPSYLQGKPTLLTQSGTTHEVPKSSAKADYTETYTKLQLMPDGKVKGTSRFIPHGSYTVSSRTSQFSNEDQDTQTVVDSLLGRYQETGTGKLKHPDPVDLSNKWQVESSFELDPVINLPGPSAFTVPIGLAPGYIKGLTKERPFANRRYPFVCGSNRHIEQVEITIPKNIQITNIPTRVQGFVLGQTYKSSYKQIGNIIHVTREYAEEIDRDSCTPKQEPAEPRRQMLEFIKTDLRSQIFVH